MKLIKIVLKGNMPTSASEMFFSNIVMHYENNRIFTAMVTHHTLVYWEHNFPNVPLERK